MRASTGIGGQLGESLRLDLLRRPEGHRVLRERVGGGADQDLARLGSGLEPGGRVDDPTRHEQLSGRTDARRGLAGLDPHADLERLVEAEPRPEPVHPVADREPRADRPHGVVLLHVGQAEHRHHGVADELLRGARGAPAAPRSRRRRTRPGPPARAPDRGGARGPVESTRSANTTVTILRSSVPSVVATGVPQLGQNRAPSGSGSSHTSHRTAPSIGVGSDPSAAERPLADSEVMRNPQRSRRPRTSGPGCGNITTVRPSCGSATTRRRPASRA